MSDAYPITPFIGYQFLPISVYSSTAFCRSLGSLLGWLRPVGSDAMNLSAYDSASLELAMLDDEDVHDSDLVRPIMGLMFLW